MLFPKKVKFRKWHTGRTNAKKLANRLLRHAELSFHSDLTVLRLWKYARLTSNEIEAARKVMAKIRYEVWKGLGSRIFPDRPFTQKPPEVKLGKGKGDPSRFRRSRLRQDVSSLKLTELMIR
jgi:large subunit ribosomal protein L16